MEKGDYTLKMHVRHEKKDLLERLTDMTVLLNQKLSSPINLDVFASHSQALIGGKKMMGATIPPGLTLPLYVAPLSNENKCVDDQKKIFHSFIYLYSYIPIVFILFRVSKSATLGTYLQGSLTFVKDDIGKKVDHYQFKYVLSEPPKKTNGPAGKSDKEKVTKWDEYNEAARDLKCTWLAKMGTSIKIPRGCSARCLLFISCVTHRYIIFQIITFIYLVSFHPTLQ